MNLTSYHPKASLDTNPGEGAAKQFGAAPSALCEVGIGEIIGSPTNAVGRPHIAPGTPFLLTHILIYLLAVNAPEVRV